MPSPGTVDCEDCLGFLWSRVESKASFVDTCDSATARGQEGGSLFDLSPSSSEVLEEYRSL
jgi:hypothetical protein